MKESRVGVGGGRGGGVAEKGRVRKKVLITSILRQQFQNITSEIIRGSLKSGDASGA